MEKEQRYIQKRLWKARVQSILFYLFRIFPVNQKKIVFCCIEGSTGYSCNPKYIAEELIRRKAGYQLIWLVNEKGKKFPKEIEVVENTLWNRAYQLSTAHIWIDNSRKQLEVRKRKGQLYLQTWHAKLGFKPTCLDRGASFSKIAYLVSKHDSDMIDYVLSNSKWYDKMLPTGMIYSGKTLRTGSPRCDGLVGDREGARKRVREKYQLPKEVKIVMYAPTFRGGSQETERSIQVGEGLLEYQRVIEAMERRFPGKWYMCLRLHPQLVARGLCQKEGIKERERVIDSSKEDDMYEILAGCDAFITDYSSAAFDAAVMRVPIFLYAEDYKEYEKERGKLLWDMRKLPFPLATNEEELEEEIQGFKESIYQEKLEELFLEAEMVEDGRASARVADWIGKWIQNGKEISNRD